jgi:hypothetical protein
MQVIGNCHGECFFTSGKKICDIKGEGGLTAFMKADTMIVDKYAAFVVNSSEVKKNSLTDPLCRDKKISLIGDSVRSKFFLKPAESALGREGNLDFYGSFVGSVLKIPGTI